MYKEHKGNCQVCGEFETLFHGYCTECLTIEEAKLIEQEKQK